MLFLLLLGLVASSKLSDTEERLEFNGLGRHLLESVVIMAKVCSSTETCGQCVGDCDTTDDCDDGLECFHRYDGETTPGCTSDSNVPRNMDVCFKPADADGSNSDQSCTAGAPCQVCLGDCDGDDSKCEGELKCYRRSTSTTSVPGCTKSYNTSIDICYNPPTTDVLKFTGWGKCGQSGYECGECEGDCDKDEDCKGATMKCFQRNEGEAVPGCHRMTAGIREDVDICYDTANLPTADGAGQRAYREDAGCSDTNKCEYCQGVCTSDLQCKGHLICYDPLAFGATDTTAYCPEGSLDSTSAVCVNAPSDGIVKKARECTENSKCDKCEADCNANIDCNSGHCFQRRDSERVPGCPMRDTDLLQKNDDVCYDRTNDKPYEDATKQCNESNECEVCEGQCANDNQCRGHLVCLQRGAGSFQGNLDGCKANPTPVPFTTPLCYLPLEDEIIQDKGEKFDDGTCSGSNGDQCGCESDPAKKCDACQGDCDSDADCKTGLRCYQRDHQDQPTPGCFNLYPLGPEASRNHDFCYNFCYRNDCTGAGHCDPNQGTCTCTGNWTGDYCDRVQDSKEGNSEITCEAIEALRVFPHYEGEEDFSRVTEDDVDDLMALLKSVQNNASWNEAPPNWSGHKYVWEGVKETDKWEEACPNTPFIGELDPNGPILCNIGISEFAEEIRQYLQDETDDIDCWPKVSGFTIVKDGNGKGACSATDADKNKSMHIATFHECRRACVESESHAAFSWRFGVAKGVPKCILHESCDDVAPSSNTISYQ